MLQKHFNWIVQNAFMINSLKTVGHFYDPHWNDAAPASPTTTQKAKWCSLSLSTSQVKYLLCLKSRYSFLGIIKYYLTRCDWCCERISRTNKKFDWIKMYVFVCRLNFHVICLSKNPFISFTVLKFRRKISLVWKMAEPTFIGELCDSVVISLAKTFCKTEHAILFCSNKIIASGLKPVTNCRIFMGLFNLIRLSTENFVFLHLFTEFTLPTCFIALRVFFRALRMPKACRKREKYSSSDWQNENKKKFDAKEKCDKRLSYIDWQSKYCCCDGRNTTRSHKCRCSLNATRYFHTSWLSRGQTNKQTNKHFVLHSIFGLFSLQRHK